MTFSIITFGCKVNSYESEAISEQLLALGYKETDSVPDFYIVNTCAVTNEAEKKCLKKIRSLQSNNPNSKIIVIGCSSQIHPDKYLSVENVILVSGNDKKSKIANAISCPIKDLTVKNIRHISYDDMCIKESEQNERAYVKIQDGCDNFCAYCVVPFTRGNSRSRSKDAILRECATLLDSGVKELVIGGIDVGSYKDPVLLGYDLTSLLSELATLRDFEYRIRVSSIEESQVSEKYIQLFKNNPKLCPHFHLPLQSGCKTTLKRMNRKYSLDNYRNLVNKIRDEIPHAAFSTDIIAGFPGETEEEFNESYSFCQEMNFMRIHAFPYSERPLTAAIHFENPVPKEVRMKRVKKYIELSEIGERNYRLSLKGKKVKVLIEEKKNGLYSGYSENYLRFSIDSKEDIRSTFQEIEVK